MAPLEAVSHRFNSFTYRKETFRNVLAYIWEDNIRMDLKEININTRNWVDSAQDSDYWRALGNAA